MLQAFESYMIKMKVLPLVMVMMLSSCSSDKRDWIKTKEGVYLYGQIVKDKSVYSWEGAVSGCIANGQGKLTVFSNNGEYSDVAKVTPDWGALNKNDWKTTSEGDFLGDVDDNLPNGFGVLKTYDDVKCGSFDKGVLDDTLAFEFYYSGQMKYRGGVSDGKYDGYGSLFAIDGKKIYVGKWKKGIYDEQGTIYKNGLVAYQGELKNGIANGKGVSYESNGSLKYTGTWKNGKYNGTGTLYRGKVVIYSGGWKDGQYDGDGVIYKNGEAHKGNWTRGHENVSIGQQISNVWNIVTNNSDKQSELQQSGIYDDVDVFVDSLSIQFARMIKDKVRENVEDRFGIFDALVRLPFQSIFVSQATRMDYAEDAMTKNLTSEDLQNWVNGKVDDYNKHADKKSQIKMITLEPFKQHEIVTESVFQKILNRENLENADNIIDLVISGVIWLVLFLIGLFWIKIEIQSGCLFQIIQSLVIMVILFFLIDIHMPTLEEQITDGIIQNYTEYLNNQNLAKQLYE